MKAEQVLEVRRWLKTHKLNIERAAVLLDLIGFKDGSRVGNISSRLAIRPANMSRIIRVLEGRGLITWAADNNDRRSSILRITEKGRMMVGTL